MAKAYKNVLNSAFQVFLIIYFGVRFSWMAGYRAVSLASFALLAYFILIVFLHYKQLTAGTITAAFLFRVYIHNKGLLTLKRDTKLTVKSA